MRITIPIIVRPSRFFDVPSADERRTVKPKDAKESVAKEMEPEANKVKVGA